jgi:phenylacetate-CoA ligase
MPSSSPRSGLYTRLAAGLLFPVHERIKKHHSVALRRELENSQWLSPESLQELQVSRTREFLQRVSRTVPYYQRVFAQVGFQPEEFRSLADLRRIPLLSKPLIREAGDDLKSSAAGPLVKYNTGGSSGEPLVFYMGMDRVSHDVAAKWRATRWWDVDIGDPELVLWGSPIELGRQDRVKALRDRVFRTRLLPAFEMSSALMDEYLATIRDTRPRMLFGYASALALLAGHAQSRAQTLAASGIKVVFATGETLYPHQREVIERTFGAPVANGYGSRDAGFIAHQCPRGSLHLSAEHIVVELLGGDGQPVAPGEEGEIVVTHLATADFPFIRYRTGDMAAMATRPCGCGRGLPAFERVTGRSTDMIHTPSGNTMHALALIYEVRDKPGVEAFKFIQAEDMSLELQVVAGAAFHDRIEAEIRQGLLARMGPGTQLTIRRVESIPAEKSGKYRYVVSRARGAA